MNRIFKIGFAAASLALSGCAPGVDEPSYSSFIIEPCESLDGYQRVAFSFHEDWMEDYSFWVDERAEDAGPVGLGGSTFGNRSTHKYVQMVTSSGNCVFRGETESLSAASIYKLGGELIGLSPFFYEMSALAREPDFEFEATEVVFVTVSVHRPPANGAVRYFAVAGGEIIRTSWE